MDTQDVGWIKYDSREQIDDLPQSTKLRVKSRRQGRVCDGLSWSELERLSSQRAWAAVLELPVPKDGDDAGLEPAIADDSAEWARL